MKVLGIDFSLNGTGLSVYNGTEILYRKVFTSIKKNYENHPDIFILMPKLEKMEEKLDWVVNEIINCSDYDFVCMEDHIGRYFNWMDGYGIIKHYLRLNKKPYLMISPTQLKKYAGSGKADKQQMTKLLFDEYNFSFDTAGTLANNIVDATWLAIVGTEYLRFKETKKPVLNKIRRDIILKLKKQEYNYDSI